MKKMKLLHWQETLATAVGIVGGIGTICFISYVMGYSLLIASFGASAVLLYGVPNVALAQPRNLLGGHFISAMVGATSYQLFGETWYSVTIAVTIAILLMMVTATVHPPGGATAIVTVLEHGGYSFVFVPVLLGAVVLLISALLANRLSTHRSYPAKS